ncbi:MAG: PQQ-dependent sugar dehydrogenase [Pseudomonadota bacterium]
MTLYVSSYRAQLGRRLLALVIALCTAIPVQAADYRLDTVVEQVEFPWSVDFLPDGRALLALLGGSLHVLEADGTLSEPIKAVPEVYFAGQGGLFDVLVDPNFGANGNIYLSYAAGDSEANGTTIAKAVLQGNSLINVEAIYSAAPQKYAPLHYGGRMAFLPDGTLLLTTGDGFDFREQAQNKATHFGKTIRINTDGSAADGNPFPTAPLVYSYGHRNPQGLAVSSSGTIYQHEHGPAGGDEINIIEAGNNYGWPAITYGMDYNGAYVSPFTKHPGMVQPAHVWTPSIAPSGLMVYEGNQFPAWQGHLFVGALVDGEVRRVDLQSGEEQAEFNEVTARVRDVREAPDGSIYILTDGPTGAVLRASSPL